LKFLVGSILTSVMLTACASKPDHFYTLNVVPEGARGTLAAPVVHVLLQVSVPVLVDRAEMIVNTAQNSVLILDHQRWAPPLSDQVSQTLARDLERRRPDLLIGDRSFDQSASPPVTLKVDIVTMSVQRAGRARIEARWRVVDASIGLDQIGGGVYEAPVSGSDYTAIAPAYSQALGGLADQLVATLQRK
jgi:uncharacterized lipoprotein YmbA